MSENKSIPVALVIFNRPKQTKQVLGKIREWAPEKLYIIADGPRPGSEQDTIRCHATRAVVDQMVDWPCELVRLYSEVNMGCDLRTVSGLNTLFEREDYAIVFDDDCLPDLSFFPFATELLFRYEDDPRIMHISGSSWELGPEAKEDPHSYFFSIYPFCWGWASWKRAWKHMSFDIPDWPQERNDAAFFESKLSPNASQRWMRNNWDHFFSLQPKIDAWDYYWYYNVHKCQGLSIVPTKNLVVNVGCDPSGTHTGGGRPPMRRYELESITFPLNHPEEIQAHPFYDKAFETICLSYNASITPSTAEHIKNTLKKPLKWFKNTLQQLTTECNPTISASKSRCLKAVTPHLPQDHLGQLNYPGYYATYRAAEYIQQYHCKHVVEVGCGASTLCLLNELHARNLKPQLHSITHKQDDAAFVASACTAPGTEYASHIIEAPLEDYEDSADGSFWYSPKTLEAALREQQPIDFLWVHAPIDPGLPSSWPLLNAVKALKPYLAPNACIALCPLNEIEGLQLSIRALDELGIAFVNEMHRYATLVSLPEKG